MPASALPPSTAIPLQPLILDKSHFNSEGMTKAGLSYLNQWAMNLTNAVTAARGQFGPAVIPGGIDVQGAAITGLPAAPSSPDEAISAGAANSAYSPASTSTALDIGGTNTLKGLAYCYQQLASGASGTVTLAKLTGGGANGSLTFQNGIITGFVQPT